MALFQLQSRFTARPKRRRQIAATSLGTETLEDRVLLAADLNLIDGSLNQVAPYEADSVYLIALLSIHNSGDESISGDNIAVQGVLSSDAIFGNADDAIAGLANLDVNLIATANHSASFSGVARVTDYEQASFLLIKIDSTDLVEESDENNNVIVIPLPPLPTFHPGHGQTSGRTGRTVVVDPLMGFSGADEVDDTGGRLTVSFGHHQGEDDEHEHDEHEHEHEDDGNVLSIKKTKTSAGVLRRKNNELRLGGSVVGIIGGGTRGGALLITFTRDVTSNDISLIAAAVSLKGRKGTPGLREVLFQFKAATVVTGLTATKEVWLA